MILLTSREAREILAGKIEVSLDLGRTKSKVKIDDNRLFFPDGTSVDTKFLSKIAKDPDNIFLVENGEVMKAQLFSEETNKLYTLRPTGTWPALEISGILMHKIKNTDPKKSAEAMVASLMKTQRIKPKTLLDTCCGLGYTTIIASKVLDSVTVIENDPNVVEMCRANPHSKELFTSKKIKLIEGDAFEEIKKFKTNSFDVVLHDPPMIAMAGDLYSNEFYSEIFRVLKHGGGLLHYTGSPGGKFRGIDMQSSVADRLKKLGFKHVFKDMETMSVVADKP